MKTLILAAVMMVGVVATAQEKKERPEQLKPEQRVELRVKQMDLQLDLTDKQQKDIQKLMLERSKKLDAAKMERKANKVAGKTLTADERFAMKSSMLDERIAMKDQMRKILTAEQLVKWETMNKERHNRITKSHKKLKKSDRR